ncbi:MAG: SIS domain-containing protein [Elusimicrobia bacterium]|nr:SIS domain-containing protein [Elusimicrobiota bacterium]
MQNKIIADINSHFSLADDISSKAGLIEEAADKIIAALKNGGTLYICGNGGSAADSQHFAAELIGRFLIDREPIKALALTANTSILTAIGNDYGFDKIFERQVDAFVGPKDILFGISTSGNSLNIINAIKTAKKKGALTMALLGCGGGKIASESDFSIICASNNTLQASVAGTCVRGGPLNAQSTPRVQEMHILIIHILCSIIENKLFPSN